VEVAVQMSEMAATEEKQTGGKIRGPNLSMKVTS
jgi:hypothetical protein